MTESVSISDASNNDIVSSWADDNVEKTSEPLSGKELTLKRRYEIRRKIELIKEDKALNDWLEDYSFPDL